jgi:hypothetical protein
LGSDNGRGNAAVRDNGGDFGDFERTRAQIREIAAQRDKAAYAEFGSLRARTHEAAERKLGPRDLSMAADVT